MLAFLFVFVGWALAVAVQILLAPLLIAALLVAGAVWALGVYLRESWAVLVVATMSGPSPVMPPEATPRAGTPPRGAGAGEPAYRSYVLVQAWLDAWTVVRRTGIQLWQHGVRAYRWVYRTLLEGALLLWPTLICVVVSTVLLAVPLAAAAVGLLLFEFALVAVWSLGWLAVVVSLGVLERVFLLVRRVVVACPHPGCYRKFGLPVYACPGEQCPERHRRLVPNQYGALRHTCRCGARLPTLIVLGRHRLPASCPHCLRPLPGRTGRVRVEHIPVVGGPDAGKSTFLCFAVAAMRAQLLADGGEAHYVNPHDEQAVTANLAKLRGGERLDKTVTQLPRAVMLDVRIADSDGRILYLFDPSGEYYASADLLGLQGYLDHTEVAVLVVDPLAIPGVEHGFTSGDRRVVEQAAPGNQAGAVRENPREIVDRLVTLLRTRPIGARLRRLLVVVTKSDVLRRTSVGAPARGSGAVREWLVQVGWGNGPRLLEECTAEVRYIASGLDLDEAAFAEPVAWLSGVRLRTERRSVRWRRRRQPYRPWVSRSRSARIPHSYRAGRMSVLVLGGCSAVAATTTAGWFTVATLVSVYTR